MTRPSGAPDVPHWTSPDPPGNAAGTTGTAWGGGPTGATGPTGLARPPAGHAPPPPAPDLTVRGQDPRDEPRRTRWAIAALITAGLSIVVPVVGGIVAMVLGVVALGRVARSGGQRRGRGMAVAAIALGALTTLGWGALIGSGALGRAGDEFMSGVEEALQQPQPSEVLDVGDCIDLDLESVRLAVTADIEVPCTQAHTAEYLGSFEIAGDPSADYPGDDAMFADGLPGCVARFEDVAGLDYDVATDFDVFVLYPSAQTWQFGDREVACFLVATNGDDLTRHVTGQG